MIDFETATIKKIKRANTDWWIHEQSMVGANGMTYIAYYNEWHTQQGCLPVSAQLYLCRRA